MYGFQRQLPKTSSPAGSWNTRIHDLQHLVPVSRPEWFRGSLANAMSPVGGPTSDNVVPTGRHLALMAGAKFQFSCEITTDVLDVVIMGVEQAAWRGSAR